MREARYQSGSLQAADKENEVAVGRGGQGELFLLFAIHGLGLCALPSSTVQAVCAADGPVRAVPGCGGAGSRFLGLASVRGQVELVFDLASDPLEKVANREPPPRGENWVIAVAPDEQTLALRVLPPLRLVRWQSGQRQDAQGGEVAKAGVQDGEATKGQGVGGDDLAKAGALAPLVDGSLELPQDEGGRAWLLNVAKLFAQLESEVHNG